MAAATRLTIPAAAAREALPRSATYIRFQGTVCTVSSRVDIDRSESCRNSLPPRPVTTRSGKPLAHLWLAVLATTLATACGGGQPSASDAEMRDGIARVDDATGPVSVQRTMAAEPSTDVVPLPLAANEERADLASNADPDLEIKNISTTSTSTDTLTEYSSDEAPLSNKEPPQEFAKQISPAGDTYCTSMRVGFDSGEYLEARSDGQTALLRGIDTGKFLPTIEYQGGTPLQRIAQVITDPTSLSNRALSFRLSEANVADADGTRRKGRVQLNLYVNSGIISRKLTVSTRIRLSSDLAILKSVPKSFDFLTLSEWWNNPTWTAGRYPFRIGLNIVKQQSAPGTPLALSVSAAMMDVGTKQWTSLWRSTNTKVDLPLGEWVTLTYQLVEGSRSTGRFRLDMRRDDGTQVTLFDISNWTHHPSDPAPDGISHFNPIKLYTSRYLIDHMRSHGKSLEVLWDDVAVHSCR